MDQRPLIAQVDADLANANLPTYSEMLDLILRAQGLMPHSSPARKSWVKRVVEAVNQIYGTKKETA
jgi:hypothetical protein